MHSQRRHGVDAVARALHAAPRADGQAAGRGRVAPARQPAGRRHLLPVADPGLEGQQRLALRGNTCTSGGAGGGGWLRIRRTRLKQADPCAGRRHRRPAAPLEEEGGRGDRFSRLPLGRRRSSALPLGTIRRRRGHEAHPSRWGPRRVWAHQRRRAGPRPARHRAAAPGPAPGAPSRRARRRAVCTRTSGSGRCGPSPGARGAPKHRFRMSPGRGSRRTGDWLRPRVQAVPPPPRWRRTGTAEAAGSSPHTRPLLAPLCDAAAATLGQLGRGSTWLGTRSGGRHRLRQDSLGYHRAPPQISPSKAEPAWQPRVYTWAGHSGRDGRMIACRSSAGTEDETGRQGAGRAWPAMHGGMVQEDRLRLNPPSAARRQLQAMGEPPGAPQTARLPVPRQTAASR